MCCLSLHALWAISGVPVCASALDALVRFLTKPPPPSVLPPAGALDAGIAQGTMVKEGNSVLIAARAPSRADLLAVLQHARMTLPSYDVVTDATCSICVPAEVVWSKAWEFGGPREVRSWVKLGWMCLGRRGCRYVHACIVRPCVCAWTHAVPAHACPAQ